MSMKQKPTPEQLAAIEFVRHHYRRAWKNMVRAAWETGNYGELPSATVAPLQQLRNNFGPTWLTNYRSKP